MADFAGLRPARECRRRPPGPRWAIAGPALPADGRRGGRTDSRRRHLSGQPRAAVHHAPGSRPGHAAPGRPSHQPRPLCRGARPRARPGGAAVDRIEFARAAAACLAGPAADRTHASDQGHPPDPEAARGRPLRLGRPRCQRQRPRRKRDDRRFGPQRPLPGLRCPGRSRRGDLSARAVCLRAASRLGGQRPASPGPDRDRRFGRGASRREHHRGPEAAGLRDHRRARGHRPRSLLRLDRLPRRRRERRLQYSDSQLRGRRWLPQLLSRWRNHHRQRSGGGVCRNA